MISNASELKKKLVVMFAGKTNALVFGEKVYSDTAPYEINGKYMISVNFFINAIGGKADGSKITYGNITAGFLNGDIVCTINGVETELSQVPEIKNGILFVPACDLCKIFSMFCREEANGLIFCSREDLSSSLDWVHNTMAMRNICESFLYDDVTGRELSGMIEEKHPNHGHPRLILTQQDFDKIRSELTKPDGDTVYKAIFKHLKGYADRFLNEAPSKYEIRDGIRLLEVCRENGERMMALAMMYNLTGSEEYAARAYEEMLVTAYFPDWNPYHFLDVGEMTARMGIAYDWLYHWMNDNQRRIIREAIVEKGIIPITEDFDDKPRKRSWNWRGKVADNWRFIIGGVGIGAMAVVDELGGADKINAERAMEQTLIDMRATLSLFAPYGAYEEGIAYWSYAMRYFVYDMKSLETAAGRNFGYIDIPGMKMSNMFVFAVNGPVSSFDYHDCSLDECKFPPETMFLADYFHKYSQALFRIEKIMKGDVYSAVELISDMFLYKPEFSRVAADDRPLDAYFPIAEVAAMRSGYDADDMWLGFHCDDTISCESHDHMDAGTFVLDALGESFFIDLGKDDYNLTDYLNCYRVRDEGHNTVIFNPDKNCSMKNYGTASIIKHQFGKDEAYAIGDMTNAYREEHGLISFLRGAKLCCGRNIAVIQDEIQLEKPAELYWFAHTKADIQISSDGKSAVLDMHGKRLLAEIISGEQAMFSVMEATPLPSSPIIHGQDPNKGIKKLTIHIKNTRQLKLCVIFTPLDQVQHNYIFTPLEKWTAKN